MGNLAPFPFQETVMSEPSEASNVVSPWGYAIPEKTVQPDLVKSLEELLEKAKAGEIVGGVLVMGYYDALASYRIVGQVGTYALVGAMTLAARNLEHITNDT